jgi:heme a synthase
MTAEQSPLWQFSLDALHALAWIAPLLLVLVGALRLASLRAVVLVTTALTVLLIGLGAYVRLSDAGLGCPDWPGCYGKLSPLQAQPSIDAAEQKTPGGAVSAPKAWKEMLHRYLATLIGALIAAIALRSVIERRARPAYAAQPPYRLGLPFALLAAVVVQGLFGKWTVTLLLKPAIVTLHLLGGMFIVALLAWLSARHLAIGEAARAHASAGLRAWAAAALFVLALQIALGGWVSANYAALACTDFPTCNGRLLPDMDFSAAFHVHRELGMDATGEPLALGSLTAIHWSHRAGALVVLIVAGGLAFRLTGRSALRTYGALLALLLAAQLGLGIANVVTQRPLELAVAHNVVASLLLVSLVMLNFVLRSRASS